MSIINKLGRRKSSVARVYLKDGKGKITINKRDHKDYFTTDDKCNKIPNKRIHLYLQL